MLLALTAIAIAAGGLGQRLGSSSVKANSMAGTETSAGILKPPVLLSTAMGTLARREVELRSLRVPFAEPTAPVAPDPAPAASPEPAPAPEPPPPFFTYIIKPGDTISAIAAAFGVDAKYILWNNEEVSADPDLLVIGQTLLIPSTNALVYNVRLGDTLSSIAARYGIDVESIVAFNGIASPDRIGEHATLLLPGAVPPAPPPQATPPSVATVAAGPAPSAGSQPTPPPPAASAPAPSSGYIWPWYGQITSTFNEWRGAKIHGAIDIEGFGNYGAPVVAAASGQVILATWDNYGLGYHVIIQHPDGSQTVYAHLSDIYVAPGQQVAQGEAIGALGCTGYCTGTHLHFAIIIGGVPVDPLLYLP